MLKGNYDLIETKETEFLRFRKFKYTHKKTFDIDVDNKKAETIGVIKFHGAWWKYIFEPSAYIIFDTKCLQDIIVYINQLMEDRKNVTTNGK